jgi:hypothetical protein
MEGAVHFFSFGKARKGCGPPKRKAAWMFRHASSARRSGEFRNGAEQGYLELRRSVPTPGYLLEKQQQYEHHEQQAQPAAGAVTPLSAIGPRWQAADEQENQDN